MWTVDANGNIVWVEGATRADVQSDPKVLGFLNPGSPLSQTILQSRASGGGGFFQPTAENVEAAKGVVSPSTYSDWSPQTGWNAGMRTNRTDAERLAALAASYGSQTSGPPPDLSAVLDGLDSEDPSADPFGLTGGGGRGGYSPSFVDTRAAEAMFRLSETPEESAMLERLLADLDFRGQAGTEAVLGGWSQVQQVNSAAAAKAAQMARDAGPEAARLWTDAAQSVLNLSSQAASVLGSTPGMQRVNISPTAGSSQIAALLAAEAPRAQQLAERMGLASSEQIAAQARTAGMMGQAYAGEIQRTVLIQANQARQAHNQRVLDRVNAERQAVAQMRFQAATTNAQLASQAAAAAAAGAKDAPTRRQRVLEFADDIDRVATFQNVADGAGLLMQIYPNITADLAKQLIESAKAGTLDFQAALADVTRG
jgi:transposase